MSDRTAQVAVIALAVVAIAAVVGVTFLIGGGLQEPATLAVLASIASAAVGGIAGMITPARTTPPESQQDGAQQPTTQGLPPTRLLQ